MKNLIKGFAVTLAMAAWLTLSTPAQAATYIRHYHLQSTSSATTVVTASNATITSVVITVSTVGTNPVQITNTAGDVLFQAASTALGTIVNYNNSDKQNGISAVGLKVVGPATAVVHIAITYYVD
jgi:hypothetical protein